MNVGVRFVMLIEIEHPFREEFVRVCPISYKNINETEY